MDVEIADSVLYGSQMSADLGHGVMSRLLDHLLVEGPEPEASSQVAHHRMANLGGLDQTVENRPDRVPQFF